MIKKIFYMLPFLLLTNACSSPSNIWASLWNPNAPEMQRTAIVDADTPMHYNNDNSVYAGHGETIGLQNLSTRDIVRCYDNMFVSAESCARRYEANGYTRFRDIPYKTANYDFLKVDSYPSRRWRDSELTPRW